MNWFTDLIILNEIDTFSRVTYEIYLNFSISISS